MALFAITMRPGSAQPVCEPNSISFKTVVPLEALVMDHTGTLFGTTVLGGGLNDGTVFSLAPPAASGGAREYRVLHAFGDTPPPTPDGAYPSGPLTFSADETALFGVAARRFVQRPR